MIRAGFDRVCAGGLPWFMAVLVVTLLAGCLKPDPTVIIGNWRAESFAVDSFKLPIAPNFEVTRNEMVLKSPDGAVLKRLPLSAIRAVGDTIELEFVDGFGMALVFVVEDRNALRFKVPMVPLTITFRRA